MTTTTSDQTDSHIAQPPPGDGGIAIVCDNYSPYLTTKRCQWVAARAEANNVEIAYPYELLLAQPYRGPVHRPALFALDGTDHASHKEQGSMIRRYLIWRNRDAADERLREVVKRANVA